MLSAMDDAKVGTVLRAIRLRRRFRQVDAAAAGVSQTLVSLAERGALEDMTLRSIRRIAAALGMRLPFEPAWRGVELAKLLDARHAALVEAVTTRLAASGWQVTPERTFAVYGERGSIDVLGWRPDCRALLIIEVKSELGDLQNLLAAFDRKRRLAPLISRESGHRPLLVGAVIVLPDEGAARNAVARFRAVFDQAYPTGTLGVKAWIRQPTRDLKGLWFVSNSNQATGKRRRGGTRRVRRPPSASPSSSSRTRAGQSEPIGE